MNLKFNMVFVCTGGYYGWHPNQSDSFKCFMHYTEFNPGSSTRLKVNKIHYDEAPDPNTPRQTVLKQHHRDESNTKSQSVIKTSVLPESGDSLLNQSKLGVEDQSDAKQSGSLLSEDFTLKQSGLEAEVQSDTKSSSLLESNESESSLKQSKLGTEGLSEMSGSLESHNSTLKQSNLRAGVPTAKKKHRSILSKFVNKFTSSKQERKDSRKQHDHPVVEGSSIKISQPERVQIVETDGILDGKNVSSIISTGIYFEYYDLD